MELINEWSRLIGSGIARSIIASEDGAIYVTGFTSGMLDGQASKGENDAFVTKFNSDGTKEWTRLLGSNVDDKAFSIDIFGTDSIYVAGDTNGNISSIDRIGTRDAYIARYSGDGSLDWIEVLGISRYATSANAVTTSINGSIYLAGVTGGDLDEQVNNGGTDAFLAKFNSNGQKEWTRLVGTAANDEAISVATDRDGYIYISGLTSGNLGELSNNGGIDAFISKFKSDGTRLWSRLVGSSSGDLATDLVISPIGDIYLTGRTFGDIDGQENYGGNDGFLTKFRSDGTKEWTRVFGSSLEDIPNSIAFGNDSIFVTGYTNGSLGGRSEEGFDGFISRYGVDGSHHWTHILGLGTYGSRFTEITSVDLVSESLLYVSGRTASMFFGGERNYGGAFIASLSINQGYGTPGSITSSSAGAFREGVTLTAPVVTGDPDGDATNPNYSYLWYKGSTAITNATASTYAVPASGAGIYKVAITYTDAQGYIATVDSPDQVISAFNNGNGTPGSITSSTAGVFREGVTLTAPVVTGDPDGDATNPNYSYQWYKGGNIIAGATASTYAVPVTGAGIYKVAVTYTDARGFTVTVDSPEQVISTFSREVQSLSSTESPIRFQREEDITVPINYTTTDGSQTPGLSFRVHYDSSLFSFDPSTGISNQAQADLFQIGTVQQDTEDFDSDASTDRYIPINIASFAGAFPTGNQPTKLVDLTFKAADLPYDSITGLRTTSINFSEQEAAQGYGFASASATLIPLEFNLDVDGDGKVTALGDGLMIIRKMFGSAFAGDALTNKAMSPNATRTSTQIHQYIQDGINNGFLDVDKDGKTTALGDGLMVIRHLFGPAFAGDALISKAISPDSPYFGNMDASSFVAGNIDTLRSVIA